MAELAGQQFNRVSRRQLQELGLSERAIEGRLRVGLLVPTEQAVFAIAPLDERDDWGRWIGATLTCPGSVLSHESGAAAWGCWSQKRPYETVTRPGSGGPRRHGGVVAYRSLTLGGDCTVLDGIPITTVERTLLDLAAKVSERALARAVREAISRGMEILRDANRPLPDHNHRIAGEEADLTWRAPRIIVEIDGGPFHLDAGEDDRKQVRWEAAGWTVRRLPSNAVYERPADLLRLAPPAP